MVVGGICRTVSAEVCGEVGEESCGSGEGEGSCSSGEGGSPTSEGGGCCGEAEGDWTVVLEDVVKGADTYRGRSVVTCCC